MSFYKPLSRWTKKRRTDVVYNKLVTELNLSVSGVNPSSSELTTDNIDVTNQSAGNRDVINEDQDVLLNVCDDSIENPIDNQTHELNFLSDSDENVDQQQYFETSEFEYSCCQNVSSESESDSSDSDESENLADELSEWAVNFGITHAALAANLKILRKYHPSLPKDPRTIINRGNSTGSAAVVVQNIAGGSYYHFGIEKTVIAIIAECNLDNERPIELQINIDGLPLYRSTNSQFWPILGLVSNCNLRQPFVIGLFYGEQKPSDVDIFLHDFVNELKTLQNTGLMYSNKTYTITLTAVICDAPARAFVKRVKGHAGYFGCDKCEQEGEYIERRMTFPEINATLRTDESFRAMSNDDHHLGPSPFAKLSVGMITQFPLDYMHLICLGVVRKLLYIWIKGPLPTRLGAKVIRDLSEALILLKEHVPVEFARKPRSVKELDRWKATELRQFLLYTGPVCLSGLLNERMYGNFMLLSVSTYILLSPRYCQVYCQFAGDLLRTFVKDAGELYGAHTLSYNLHATVHLADEALLHGPLDNVCGFIFENYLGKLKKMIRKPHKPLQQVVRRLSERGLSACSKQVDILQKEHHAGPVPCHSQFSLCKQYKEYHQPEFKVTLLGANNCVLIGNEVARVRNFITMADAETEQNVVVYQKFKTVAPYYTYPITSSDLEIYTVSNLSKELLFASLSEVRNKCILLSLAGQSVAIPFVH